MKLQLQGRVSYRMMNNISQTSDKKHATIPKTTFVRPEQSYSAEDNS